MDVVKKYLQPAFGAGYLSNFGPAYKTLCDRLRAYLKLHDNKEIIIVSSGHTALQAAYYAFGLKTPAIPDYTFRSTLVASLETPIVVDCNTNGFLDMEAIDNCDGAILVCPMSRIPNITYYEEECKKKNIPLIIDGAATFGTPDIYNHGDCFCLSFHATKTYSVGECGAVICSKEIAKKIKQYINFGLDENKNPIMSGGTNAKVSEYTCAIGLAILDKIESEDSPIKIRLRNAEIYNNRLAQYVLPSFSAETVYQTFPIYTHDDQKADNIRQRLKENSIEFLQYYKPLTYMSNANRLYMSNICLPCHHNVSEEQIQFICDIVLQK